jgi:hypothetical protein
MLMLDASGTESPGGRAVSDLFRINLPGLATLARNKLLEPPSRRSRERATWSAALEVPSVFKPSPKTSRGESVTFRPGQSRSAAPPIDQTGGTSDLTPLLPITALTLTKSGGPWLDY